MRASSNIEVTACRDLATIFAARASSTELGTRSICRTSTGGVGEFGLDLGVRFGDRYHRLARWHVESLAAVDPDVPDAACANGFDVLGVGDDEG
jgi:hypothetical protein